MPQLTILNEHDNLFPNVDQALDNPNGLLAVGGTLNTERLINAYHHGIFPWYSEGEPIMWWSPNPRCVFYTDQFLVSRSFRRFLNKKTLRVTINNAFSQVITACSLPRSYQPDTWINQDIINAYNQLHTLGVAHSIEVWQDDVLVGGVYGVFVNNTFCGESMFSTVTNASKTGLYALCQWLALHNVTLVDCQVPNPHLISLGAQEISRELFISHITAKKTPCSSKVIDWYPKELPV